MGVLIDSSVLVAAERGQLDLGRILEDHRDDSAAVSAVTASELLHGVHRLKAGVKRARAELVVERLLARLPVLAFDLEVARVHATLSAELRARGSQIGAYDLIIAATAVAHGLDVATRDLRSFPRIRGLTVLRW